MDILIGFFVLCWMLFINSYLHRAAKAQEKMLEELKEIKLRLR